MIFDEFYPKIYRNSLFICQSEHFPYPRTQYSTYSLPPRTSVPLPPRHPVYFGGVGKIYLLTPFPPPVSSLGVAHGGKGYDDKNYFISPTPTPCKKPIESRPSYRKWSSTTMHFDDFKELCLKICEFQEKWKIKVLITMPVMGFEPLITVWQNLPDHRVEDHSISMLVLFMALRYDSGGLKNSHTNCLNFFLPRTPYKLSHR